MSWTWESDELIHCQNKEINQSVMEINALETSWRTTQQVAIFPPDGIVNKEIKGWGSGFFYAYKKHLLFVTADHVVHYDDHEFGMNRIGEDDNIAIFNNKNSENRLETMLTPIGGVFSFDKYDLSPIMQEKVTEDDIELASIPDMIDVAFAIVDKFNKGEYQTHELSIENEVIVAKGLPKFFLNSCRVCSPNKSDTYLVTGTVRNIIRNSVIIDRCNAIYGGMKYVKDQKDGNIVLNYPGILLHDDWAGLSGGPVIKMDGELLGIILEVEDGGHNVTVKPMAEVHRLMDYALKVEGLE